MAHRARRGHCRVSPNVAARTAPYAPIETVKTFRTRGPVAIPTRDASAGASGAWTGWATICRHHSTSPPVWKASRSLKEIAA